MIVDHLTISSPFIPIPTKRRAEYLAMKYVRQVVRYHGAPCTIVPDRDISFTFVFWCTLHKDLGMELVISSTYHHKLMLRWSISIL